MHWALILKARTLNKLTSQNSDFTPWPQDFVKKYKDAGFWQEKTLADLLKAHLQHPHFAIIDDTRAWTYGQLDKYSSELANKLLAMGIQKGDILVIHLPNSCILLEILFALFKIGACPVMALPSHRYTEIEYFCRFTEAKAYIGAEQLNGFDCLPLFRKLNETMNFSFSYLIDLETKVDSFTDLLTVSTDVRDLVEEQVIQPADVALFQLSGGTTGVPKLIPRTHYDYLYSVLASNEICQINENSKYLAVLPVCHNFTMSSPGALGVLAAGGTLVLTNSASSDTVFDLIKRYQITITAVVPPIVIAWLNGIEMKQSTVSACDISSLQILQVGGAKLSYEVAKRVTPTFNCILQQVFGMAEGLVNYTRLDDDLNTILTTQGRPISQADEIQVLDDNDDAVLPGETGHLLTRGPYTIRGYYKAPEHNAKNFTSDGFYRTGDIVRVTHDGYLIVEGRSKDQINKGGEKIAAEELENILLAHPDVFDAAVVAMPDEYLGEKICAFVIGKNPEKPLKAIELSKFMRSKELATFKSPDRFEIVNHFPKTKFGKVDKKSLRLQIADKLTQRLSHA